MEKKYNYVQAQIELQEKWLAHNTYQTTDRLDNLFSIDTPPPTVSGTLHIGHIFSYTQTDIIARYKRMRGFNVFYPFGFDDNGLPTERYVEKKLDIRAHTVERAQFIEMCLQETVSARKTFTQLWQKMGISADWKKSYSTISQESRRIAQQSFLDLLEKKYVYRQYQPALYCTTCRTSVSQADLDDDECDSFFNDIVFLDQDCNQLVVATTRPELLASCVALLFHPDDARYKDREGQYATTPLFNIKVPLLRDELVKIDKGTGLVMVCTFGDKTDIEWYKKYNFDYIQSIGVDGKFLTTIPHLGGCTVKQARTKIVELLQSYNLILNQRPIKHTVSVHERCKTPVEYLMLAQWFVSLLPHKEKLLALADTINWYPSFMKTRYINWVQNLNWDWGISRQRSFGIPFPVWHCRTCNAVLSAQQDELPIDPQLYVYNKPCNECGGTDIYPDSDVMDTWNTSSLTPYICAQIFTGSTANPFSSNATDFFIPMTMRPQAHDIIRTWAFYTIVKTYLHNKNIPWKNIVISGHVLTDHKEKISKSKQNSVMNPDELLQQYPADAIRYWTASGNLGYDTAFSSEQLKIGQRLITKLWNAFLFALPHITQLDNYTQPSQLGIVNEWLMYTLTQTEIRYHDLLDNKNEFGQALLCVEEFFWQTYCENYIELTKNQLFNPEQYSAQTLYATRWTLYHVGLRILKLYAPYLPYVTEIIYHTLYQKNEKIESLHQTSFVVLETLDNYKDSATNTDYIIQVTTSVRKIKTEKQLSLKTPINTLTINLPNDHIMNIFKNNEQTIKGITQANTIVYTLTDTSEDLSQLCNNELNVYVTVQ